MIVLLLTIILGLPYLALVTYWLYLKSKVEARIRTEETEIWEKMRMPSFWWRHYAFMNFTGTVLFNQIRNPEISALGLKAKRYGKLSVYLGFTLFIMLVFLTGSST